ncbi:MAG TPA: YbjN domain-containing protein [Bacteroidia bacterium]|nr:YbjN domain-containing protein [Bacteroidia bacterium]
MEAITHYHNMVEETIKELGVDPALCRGQSAGQWNLKMGSASVWIDTWQSKDAQGNLIDFGYLQMMAPVCEVPVQNQALFTKELLELNHSLYGVAFTIFQDKAYIKAIRELDGIDKAEIKNTFNRVGIYADEYDDKLKAKYFPVQGGRG